MIRISVHDLWEEFAKKAIPQVPRQSVQFVEMKKSFYGGVAGCLFEIRDKFGGPDISEEDGATSLQDMIDQVGDFYKSLL